MNINKPGLKVTSQNVLHVIPSLAPIRGGPSQAILEMVQALRQVGINADIFTTNDNGPDLLDVPLNQCSFFQEIPVWFFPRFSPPVLIVREFSFSASFSYWLWQNIHRYDLLHIHAIFSYVPTISMAIARLKQVPYIVRPLGQLCHWSLQQSATRKQIYLRLIEKANLQHSQAIHFTSIQEQAEAETLNLSAKSVVIPHGITAFPIQPAAKQQLRQQLDCPADVPIILFLSRLHPKKGLEYLIPALGQLLDHPFRLAIAGDGDAEYVVKLHDLVESHHLTSRTHFLGFVTGEQKQLLLQGSDLFVLTSHSENFGVAVLEAMAAKLPVLLTPGVALADVARQYQLGYFPELNIHEITDALLKFFLDSDAARAMGDRARRHVLNHYTWDHVATQLIEVYSAILEQKALPYSPRVKAS